MNMHATTCLRSRLQKSGATLLALLMLSGCSGRAVQSDAPPSPQVNLAPVAVQPIDQPDEFSDRDEAIENVQLRPRVSGYIKRVDYIEGQEVKKGDILFTIDSRSHRAELACDPFAQADSSVNICVVAIYKSLGG